MITPASAEWVLLSAIYHHVLASSPSPERAKIDIEAARKDGRLRLRAEVRKYVAAGPDLQLRPGEQPPKMEPVTTTGQPLPRDSFFDHWDWERNRASRRDAATKSLFEYVDIVGHRDDALALWPTAPVAPVPAPTTTAMMASSPQSLAPQIDPFRTGAPGRPTAKAFIVAETKRRISSGEITPQRGKLASFAQTLFDWYEQERQKLTPHGPKVKAATIENSIRDLWRSSLPGGGEDKI